MLLEHIFKITNTCNNYNYTTNNKYNNQQETTSNIECNKCTTTWMPISKHCWEMKTFPFQLESFQKNSNVVFFHLFSYSRIVRLSILRNCRTKNKIHEIKKKKNVFKRQKYHLFANFLLFYALVRIYFILHIIFTKILVHHLVLIWFWTLHFPIQFVTIVNYDYGILGVMWNIKVGIVGPWKPLACEVDQTII